MNEEKRPIPRRRPSVSRGKKSSVNGSDLKKLQLLIAVVNRSKAEFYMDLLQSFEVNMQLSLAAHGTASTETLRYLGLTDSEKAVILAVIRQEKATEALYRLEEKFNTIRGGKGIAYTVPLSSTIGVAIYQFLANHRK